MCTPAAAASAAVIRRLGWLSVSVRGVGGGEWTPDSLEHAPVLLVPDLDPLLPLLPGQLVLLLDTARQRNSSASIGHQKDINYP